MWQVFKFSAVKQQLECFHVENVLSARMMSPVESKPAHVSSDTKVLGDELELQKRAEKVDDCEECGNWGTVNKVSSDS